MAKVVENKIKQLCEEDFKGFITYNTWKKVGFSPRFGVLISLSALKSRRNSGVGDFVDLISFKNLLKSMGGSIIQVLPINDMGRGKVPYASMSAFALDPVYIAIDEIPEMKHEPSGEVLDYLHQNRHIVEDQKISRFVNIDRLRSFKFGVLYKLFWNFVDRNRFWNTPRWRAFQSYVKNNEYWLDDYAIFRSLKNRFDWSPWQEWPVEYRDRHSEALKNFRSENADEILFVKFVQWTAYEQMLAAHNRCNEENVLLKGDIPLQVDFESADVWAHREYFQLETCAGAPPDQYSQMGQNWGTPTYEWDRVAADNYIWWRKRLEYAAHFYDIFRIDHVVGLFRIWTIPITEEFPRGKPSGWNGYFAPEDNGITNPVWENHGKTLLKMMIESCDMLPIGEDLGTIPYVCRKVLKEMGIPGYKVLIWEREWGKKGAPFFDPKEYDYISMATSTTHDFWTLPGYWLYRENNPDRAREKEESIKDLWKFVMGKKSFTFDYSDDLHWEIMSKLFYSQSVFLIMPFGDVWGTVPDLFAEDIDYDRINDPSNPERESNWVNKLPVDLEDFHSHKLLKEKINIILNMAKSSGRAR